MPLHMWQVWYFFLPCLVHSSRARLFPSCPSASVIEILPAAFYPAAPAVPGQGDMGVIRLPQGLHRCFPRAWLCGPLFHFPPSSIHHWVWLRGYIRAVSTGADPIGLGAGALGVSHSTNGDSGLSCPSSPLSATCGEQTYLASCSECTIASIASWRC